MDPLYWDMGKAILSYTRSPELWLPVGYDWSILNSPENRGIRFAELTDILYPIPAALLILTLRYVVNRMPICGFMALANRYALPGKERRFAESLWRGCCYISSFLTGASILWDKSWLWNIQDCWIGFPFHNQTRGLQVYYLVGAGIYLSFTISQFYDVRRKDFWEMFIHHITTLTLMTFSWLGQLTRIGTLILFLHDFADIWIELTKVFSYTQQTRIRDGFFVLFTISWAITRLYIFPRHIIYSINFDAMNHIAIFPLFSFLSLLVSSLFLLHLFWTWYIVKTWIMRNGTPKDRDCRSASESENELEVAEHPKFDQQLQPLKLETVEHHMINYKWKNGVKVNHRNLALGIKPVPVAPNP